MNKNDILRIWLTDDAIWLRLHDGREASEAFCNYPRLNKATEAERKAFEVSHFGLHWPALDEDLSFAGFFN